MNDIRAQKIIHKYLRKGVKFPHIWCPGCGHGIILGALLRAIDKLQIPKDDVCLISGIGCAGRVPGYVDFNTLHTTHGRALSFATGIKFANPKLKVIVVMGDGDAVAIGGNHFIHTARRNIDITTIVFNNNIYGMTGGQYSATTPSGSITATSAYQHIEKPFDICDLAMAAGSTFVARSTVYHAPLLEKLIEQALEKKGFSVVEAMTTCFTTFGRKNKKESHIEMMKEFNTNAYNKSVEDKLTDEQKTGKFPIGVLKNVEAREYCDIYQDIIDSFKKDEVDK